MLRGSLRLPGRRQGRMANEKAMSLEEIKNENVDLVIEDLPSFGRLVIPVRSFFLVALTSRRLEFCGNF